LIDMFPGTTESSKNNDILLTVESRAIQNLVTKIGRDHFQSRLFKLEIEPKEEGGTKETYRVLPRTLHINAITDKVENVCFLRVSPERRVELMVPLRTMGEDVSPGIKKGGWAHLVTRTIPLSCPGDKIPPYIEVDISKMDAKQKLVMGQLARMLPDGIEIVSKDPLRPVCMMSGSRREEEEAAPAPEKK